MTTPFLANDLRGDEGLRLTAYPDPLSGGDPWTIGYGHTGPEVHKGLTWAQADADAALEADITHACACLDKAIPWWRDLSDLRQDVFANMVFNMGINGFLNFKHMLAAADAGDYDTAADEMLDSKWAQQVGHRATRLAEQMRTGEHLA